jgi:hypothetical protein
VNSANSVMPSDDNIVRLQAILLECRLCGHLEHRHMGTEPARCPNHSMFDVDFGPFMEYRMTFDLNGLAIPDHDPNISVETS